VGGVYALRVGICDGGGFSSVTWFMNRIQYKASIIMLCASKKNMGGFARLHISRADCEAALYPSCTCADLRHESPGRSLPSGLLGELWTGRLKVQR